MDLLDLKTFAMVARLGSVTKAAVTLNTVQSNITNRIQSLEREIGLQLFERHSRGVALTFAGKRLLPFAERMERILREALTAARDDGTPNGPLALGSMETTAARRLPCIITEFHHLFPEVLLSLRTGPTAELIELVLSGHLDGAFVAGPVEHSELEAHFAFNEELVIVTAKKWKNLEQYRKSKKDTGATILVFRVGCSYRQRLEQILTKMAWPATSRFEFGTLDGMIGCVAADMGMTLLPRAIVDAREMQNLVRTHNLTSASRHVDTLFIRRRSAYCHKALIEFIRFLENHAVAVAAQ